MQVKRAAIPSCSEIRTGKSRRQPLGAFWRRQSGGLAIYAALSLPLFLGMAGVGLDMSVWYAMKRDVQGMVDSAAISAAHTLMGGGTESEATAAALADAQLNGYDAAPAGSQLLVTYNTVVAGSTTETVQATVRQEAPLSFSQFFLDEIFVSAFAASGYAQLGTQCVLALHPTAAGAITFTGTTTADVGCGVTSNSDHPSDSILVTGNAVLTANPVQANGGIAIGGAGQINSDFPLIPYSHAVPDPFETMASAMPSRPLDCTIMGTTVGPSDTATFAPMDGAGGGCVAGGSVTIDGTIWVKGDATFAPGTYYIHEGDFRMNSGGSVTATGGVTFILTGDAPADVGEWKMNGTADLVIEAPSAGYYAGIAIMQDPIAAAGGDNKINGGSGQMIDGVIYFPSQNLTFNGGSDLVDSCVQIIASMIDFQGNSVLDNDLTVCEAVGVSTGGTGGGQLVVLVR
jgi:Flp pilus assembly protein TadG